MAAFGEQHSCALVELPAEIQKAICDLVSQEPISSFGRDSQVATSRVDFEAERSRIGSIQESLPYLGDLLRLSCTCSFYRSLLAPQTFAVIYLHNTEKSGLSVQALAGGQHSGHVKELRYRGLAPGILQEAKHEKNCADDDAFSNTEAVFPPDVHRVLSRLNQFPNLQRLSIEFPFDYTEAGDPYDFLMEPETPEQVATAESEQAWRALMAKSFAALSQNTSDSVPSLELGRFHSLAVSTLDQSGFREFLANLKSFSLSLRGWDNGAGWNLNTMYSFPPFAERLGSWFFDHLCSVADFTLEADESAPIGLHPGMNHAPLALRREQMPHLRCIDLKYIIVCAELINFLVSHLNTLESITLRDCSCSVNGLSDVESPPYWHHLFIALAEARSEQLKIFEVSKVEMEWTTEEEIRKVRKKLEEGDQRLFAYMYLDDKYGFSFQDTDEAQASLFRGDDQRAYNGLMEIVNANALKG